jgi:hypothetical protein
MSQPALTEVSPDDRLPTFTEIDGFDANAAWDRLSPTEQRRVGILAVRLGTLGQINTYVPTKDWPIEQQDVVCDLENETLKTFMDQFELLWGRLFGWAAPREWSKPIIKRVA